MQFLFQKFDELHFFKIEADFFKNYIYDADFTVYSV